MRTLAILAGAMTLAVPATAEEASEVEAAFVACLADKQEDLIAKIRDADSQEGFEAAMKQGLEICPTDTAKMSMAKLFRALNAHGEAEAAE